VATMKSVPESSDDAAIQLPDLSRFRIGYDRKRDTLLVSVRNPGPAVSVDIGDGVWMRVIPTARQDVGFEIEDFERIFLRKHPDQVAAWRGARKRGAFGFRHTGKPGHFVESMLGYLMRSAASHPPHLPAPA
jgi:hypothetical protein